MKKKLTVRKARESAQIVADVLEVLAAGQGFAKVSIVDDPHCGPALFSMRITHERDGLVFQRDRVRRDVIVSIIADALSKKQRKT